MPDVVYKIATAAEWNTAVALGQYGGSRDDVRDGYIHLSSDHQLRGTLEKYFRGQTDLVVIAFEAGALGPQLRWEKSRGGDLFPHYYGTLCPQHCLWSRPLTYDASNGFDLSEEFLRC